MPDKLKGGGGAGPGGRGASVARFGVGGPTEDRDETTQRFFNDSNISVEREGRDLAAATKSIFGRELSDEQIGRLVGAPDGAEVLISTDTVKGKPSLIIETEHPFYDGTQFRTVAKDDKGKPVIENVSFALLGPAQGNAIGPRIMATQIRQAEQLKVPAIEADATRSSKMFGHYAWARMGFDAPIPDGSKAQLKAEFKAGNLPFNPSKMKKLSDLMLQGKDGQNWWRENGDTLRVRFDVKPGSISRRVFESYLDEKGIII